MIEAFLKLKTLEKSFPVSLSMIMVGLCFLGNNLFTLPYITTGDMDLDQLVFQLCQHVFGLEHYRQIVFWLL
ncbi:MAG: hypothetical protein CM15mP109_12220 [Candidatus Dadabacteria bacterium]|nr:MAG: hypothetical protein CM15mP109_12220 [Candidatus Dadabacteria bacterium]